MPITSISRDTPNNVSIVRITCTDTLSDIATPNYIKLQTPIIYVLNKGTWQWYNSDVLLFDSSDGNAFFVFTDDTFSSLILLASSTDGTVSPGLMNQIAYYALSGTVVSGTNTLPSAVAINPSNANGGTGATGNTFWAGNNTWKTVSSATSHSIYTVYVAVDGNDITGNGSINAPYKTISHALSTITGASALLPYEIICLSGVYNETSIALKPFVSLYGNNSTLNITGNLSADASWSSGGEIVIENFLNVNITGTSTIDVSSSLSNVCKIYIRFLTFNTFSSDFSIIGGDSTTVILNNLISFTSTQNISITNCIGGIFDSIFNDFNYTNNSLSGSFIFILNSNIIGGYTNLININPAAEIDLFFGATKPLKTVTATGINAKLFMDVASVMATPILVGGSTVNYLDISNGLSANYTPINYVPDSTGGTDPSSSVAAHLHGIDNALSGVATANNYVWVSNTGSDVSGNGSFSNPFSSVSHALTTITTASSVNTFTIVLIGGTISNPSQIFLKPFVSISGLGNGIFLETAPYVGLDSSWGTTSNGTISLTNFSYELGDIVFDFSSFSNVTTHNINVTQLNSSGRSISLYGNANTQINGYVTDCKLFSLVIDNAYCESFNNIITNAVLTGLFHSPVRNNTIYFFNNHIQSMNLNGGSGSGFLSKFYFISNKIEGSLSASGSDTTLYLDIVSYKTPSLSSGATSNYGIIGVLDGSNAASGNVGEYFSQSELVGSAQPLSSGVTSNVFSVTNALPPGDWDVFGTVVFNPDVTTTSTSLIAGLSTSSNTLPTLGAENNTSQIDASFPAGKAAVLNVGPVRMNSAFVQTIFLVAQATFAVSTMSVYGFVSARRVR